MAINTKSPSKRFFDESFAARLSQLQRKIQINKNYIILGLFDPKSLQYVGLEEYYLGEAESWIIAQQEIDQIFHLLNDSNSLHNDAISVQTNLYTLIPNALFDEGKLSSYLKFNHSIPDFESYSIRYDSIENMEGTVIYGIPSHLNNSINNHFSDFKIQHHSTSFIDLVLLESNEDNAIYLNIQYERFDILYLKDKKLHFFNSFKYQTVEDFIYYLLYVIEQLELDREEIPAILYGEFEQKSSLYDILYKYIRNVRLGERPLNINYSNVLTEIPDHQYYSLFSQYLCE